MLGLVSWRRSLSSIMRSVVESSFTRQWCTSPLPRFVWWYFWTRAWCWCAWYGSWWSAYFLVLWGKRKWRGWMNRLGGRSWRFCLQSPYSDRISQCHSLQWWQLFSWLKRCIGWHRRGSSTLRQPHQWLHCLISALSLLWGFSWPWIACSSIVHWSLWYRHGRHRLHSSLLSSEMILSFLYHC